MRNSIRHSNQLKNRQMKYNHFLIIILIPLIFYGCHKDFEFQNFDYKTFNRLVGPEGGMINFYANYDNDTKSEVIVSLNVPAGALDSLMVFNMYQFEDFEVATQMNEGFAKIGSKFLYFVPFYESEGYHERGQMELNYHLSVKFKSPITVTYHPLANYSDLSLKNWQEVELYNNYYKTTNQSYKVYRIKIPKLDQWGESYNIYVNWTRQGYPNGYDATDLSYLVSGKWTSTNSWGTGDISMENWEPVAVDEFDMKNDLISFKIYDTDYIYVVARDIYLQFIPAAIAGYIGANFQALQIKRASYDEDNYKVYFTDNSVAVFDKYQNFQYLLNENLTYADLPSLAQSYIKIFYSSYVVKKVMQENLPASLQYEVLLSGGIKLYFNIDGSLIGIYQYGYDPLKLPAPAKTYLQTNHPGEIITNVAYDSLFYAKYIVYLSSNAKVYFYGDGTWFETYYSKLNSDKLPSNVFNYFKNNYPNAIFSEIDHTIGIESSYYDVYLADNKWFYFSDTGELQQYEFRNIPENDLPVLIKDYVNTNYPTDIMITNIYHSYSYGQEWYEIYFTDLSLIKISPQGVLLQK